MTVRALTIVLLACSCVAAPASFARTGPAVGETAFAESVACDFDATPIPGEDPASLQNICSPRTSAASDVATAPVKVEASGAKSAETLTAEVDGLQSDISSRLRTIATQLSQLSNLDLTNDVEWTTEGPACYLSDSDLAHPEKLLYDGKLTGQGLFLIQGEPFTVKMAFASHQRIRSVQVLYAGDWDAAGIPEVAVIGVLSGGRSQQIGTLPPVVETPSGQPIVQQLNFGNDPTGNDNEWRRLYLDFKDVPVRMGLVEIRVVGFDRDVKNIARALHSLSKTPGDITSGTISSVAAMTRARRMPGAKAAAKDDVVQALSAMVTELSGLELNIAFGETDMSGDEPGLSAKIEVHNNSDIGLEWSMVKLELPAGWRAAPSRFTVEELAPHDSIFMPLTFWPGPDSSLFPSAYLYGAYAGQPIFVMTPPHLSKQIGK